MAAVSGVESNGGGLWPDDIVEYDEAEADSDSGSDNDSDDGNKLSGLRKRGRAVRGTVLDEDFWENLDEKIEWGGSDYNHGKSERAAGEDGVMGEM